MNMQFARLYLLAMLLIAAFGAGCDKASAPAPQPFAAEEVPGAMQNAFSKAQPELKQLADQCVALFQAKDYAKAFNMMQILVAKPGLDKDQINVTARATL